MSLLQVSLDLFSAVAVHRDEFPVVPHFVAERQLVGLVVVLVPTESKLDTPGRKLLENIYLQPSF